ncbi:hypothetical protein [Pseudomonas piscis]|uniref:hypothetical protein n=1 Tax=Pseudomonas piscis TaxID=2614538 RepID=UPI0021D5F41B|nr:hypothetical protein [Pseudomonas piscis]MCU7647206.1 hypothetical protein [Pseudomonas piscis]
MASEGTYSKEWLRLSGAEMELFSACHEFRHSAGFISELSLALADRLEQGTALRFIRDDVFADTELDDLLPGIIDAAIEGDIGNVPLARSVLCKFRTNDLVKEKLASMLSGYLEVEDYYVYMRVAELLLELDYFDLKAVFVSKCKESRNEDVVEVYDFFADEFKAAGL